MTQRGSFKDGSIINSVAGIQPLYGKFRTTNVSVLFKFFNQSVHT